MLQGKGGVGKTFVASLLAQYLYDSCRLVACIDTDPVNASLCGISGLGATAVELLDRDGLDVDELDRMIERLLTEESDFVIDNGAASFLPLSRYLVENDIARLITAHGKGVVVHTIVTGGPAMLDTARALAAIIEQFPEEVALVVWLNAYFGRVVTDAGDPFEQTPLYRDNRRRIAGLIRLEPLNPHTFGHTLAQMLDSRLTFAEAEASPAFRTVARQRLRQIRAPIWAQMQALV